MATQRRRTAGRSAKPERVGLGGGSVDEHLSRPKRRSGGQKFARVGDGNTIIARAVDTSEYFKDGYVHPVQFERKDGSTYTMDVRCLDPDDEGEPCPGCRDDLERRYKFWMVVIQRDAPKENKQGKVIGEEDQVRILSGANRLVKELNAKQKRKDLSKRDVEISQKGIEFEVQYEVEWAEEEDTPLSKEDKALVEDAEDIIKAFERYTSIPEEEDFYEAPTFDDDDDEDVGDRSKRRGSMFDKNRKKGTSARSSSKDEDDEDDDDDADDDDEPRRKPKGALAARKKAASGGTSGRKIRRR